MPSVNKVFNVECEQGFQTYMDVEHADSTSSMVDRVLAWDRAVGREADQLRVILGRTHDGRWNLYLFPQHGLQT